MSVEIDWGRFPDSAFGRPVPKRPQAIRPGASAVIFNDAHEVLLELRSDFNLWGLPGGRMDVGESLEETVVREVLEETGLTVRVERLVGVYSDPRLYAIACYPSGDIVHSVVMSFVCGRVSGELKYSAESLDLRYFPTDSLPDDMMKIHRLQVEDALVDTPQPFVR
jgi:8-oxo-dGTP pyrophosphatase MutT (NUDIX family)